MDVLDANAHCQDISPEILMFYLIVMNPKCYFLIRETLWFLEFDVDFGSGKYAILWVAHCLYANAPHILEEANTLYKEVKEQATKRPRSSSPKTRLRARPFARPTHR